MFKSLKCVSLFFIIGIAHNMRDTMYTTTQTKIHFDLQTKQILQQKNGQWDNSEGPGYKHFIHVPFREEVNKSIQWKQCLHKRQRMKYRSWYSSHDRPSFQDKIMFAKFAIHNFH